LCHGDQIEIAPWNFDFIDQQSPVNMSRTVVMSGGKENSQENSNIARVKLSAPAGFAQNQLVLVLKSNEAIYKAKDESSVYEALVNAARESTQFENVAFVRSTGQGEAVEVLAQVGNIQDPSGKTRMSRTMLRQARQGPKVRSRGQVRQFEHARSPPNQPGCCERAGVNEDRGRGYAHHAPSEPSAQGPFAPWCEDLRWQRVASILAPYHRRPAWNANSLLC
jgi:hypothetical protein